MTPEAPLAVTTVTGPNGDTRTLTRSGTFTNLTPGAFTVGPLGLTDGVQPRLKLLCAHRGSDRIGADVNSGGFTDRAATVAAPSRVRKPRTSSSRSRPSTGASPGASPRKVTPCPDSP